jgi:hypothetical protein
MAQPMTLAQLESQFKKFGVEYRVIGDPKTHRRDPQHGAWGPVFGCGTHHTGDDAPDTADRKIISQGRAGLPGPLAHFGLNDNGVLDIHSVGRANHFGGGDPRVLKAVQNESYDKYPPASRFHEGSSGAADGNTHFYGCEIYYSGGHKMTAAQYKTIVRLWAAICDHHGWSSKSVIGHKEWSSWKSDPASQDMHSLRVDVQALVNAHKKGATAPDKPVATPHIDNAVQHFAAGLKELGAAKANPALVDDVAAKIKVQVSRL